MGCNAPKFAEDDMSECSEEEEAPQLLSSWGAIEFDSKVLTSEKKDKGLFLYVCQEDEEKAKIDQLSLFDNNRKLYPYNPKKSSQIGRNDGLSEELIPDYLDNPNRSWKKNIFSGAFYYLNYFDYQKVKKKMINMQLPLVNDHFESVLDKIQKH